MRSPSAAHVALVVPLLILATARCAPRDADQSRQYAFVWAADADGADSDFLLVIDVDSTSRRYAQVVATLPTGSARGMPHHIELQMPRDGHPLFANTFHSGRTWLLDLRDPLRPRIAGSIDSVPGYRQPHTYVRLRDGRVLTTYQFGDGSRPGDPGGIAMFTPDGRLLRTGSSHDPAFPAAPIRTYALDVAAEGDRMITTSSPMDTTHPADVVQLWRLANLSVQRTLAVPQSPGDSTSYYPFEVRFLDARGTHAFMNTYNCGFYYISDLDGASPMIESVMALPQPHNSGCGVPLLWGHYWIMPVGTAREFLVLDISNPRRPAIASRLAADSGTFPHWLARDPDSDRVLITDDGINRVMLARFDSVHGTLAWDERFRETRNGARGVSLNRETWPHGASGPAKPHGAIFGSAPAAAAAR